MFEERKENDERSGGHLSLKMVCCSMQTFWIISQLQIIIKTYIYINVKTHVLVESRVHRQMPSLLSEWWKNREIRQQPAPRVMCMRITHLLAMFWKRHSVCEWCWCGWFGLRFVRICQRPRRKHNIDYYYYWIFARWYHFGEEIKKKKWEHARGVLSCVLAVSLLLIFIRKEWKFSTKKKKTWFIIMSFEELQNLIKMEKNGRGWFSGGNYASFFGRYIIIIMCTVRFRSVQNLFK